MDQRDYFLNQNIAQLEQGRALLREISDDIYALSGHQYFGSGVGRHMRHILDHYQCFIGGYPCSIDYDSRERDVRIEEERSYALGIISDLIGGLTKLPEKAPDRLEIRCNEGDDAPNVSLTSQSSVVRELQYLSSHTIHHYAIIAMILKVLGISTPHEFGVAPSTISYEKQQSSQRASLEAT